MLPLSFDFVSVGTEGLLQAVPDSRSSGKDPVTGLYASPQETDVPFGLGLPLPRDVLRNRIVRHALEPSPILGPRMLRASQK
jgi:hypothetical protein